MPGLVIDGAEKFAVMLDACKGHHSPLGITARPSEMDIKPIEGHQVPVPSVSILDCGGEASEARAWRMAHFHGSQDTGRL
jgi:hypothetical protein